MKKLIPVFAIVVFLFGASHALAAGIELEEQSAVAQGRVLAVRALLNDPSTVFYNSAGLAYLDGFSFALGDTMAFPSFNYSDPSGPGGHADAQNTNTVVPPPHAYAAYGMSLGGNSRLGVGLGVNVPFGLTLIWPEEFAGRHLVQESALMCPEITLGAAYSPVKQVSIGAAFVASPASVYLKRYWDRISGWWETTANPSTTRSWKWPGQAGDSALPRASRQGPSSASFSGLPTAAASP